MDFPPTKLDYHVDMFNLQSHSRFLSLFKAQDGRIALILESTVFHPQGGGQPSDTGLIVFLRFGFEIFRSRCSIERRNFFEGSNPESGIDSEKGKEVYLTVDESRRKLNSSFVICWWNSSEFRYRLLKIVLIVMHGMVGTKFQTLHSAGHLLDMCMQKVGLGHLEPGKGYHFPDGPFVEYKGSVPQEEFQVKQKELEAEANELISKGGKVYAAILPYEEASVLCGGSLPDYISKGSTPRIIKLGDSPGCPCGGTHVSNLSDIISMKITQMRTKKGMTKVFYTIAS
ncbi:putative alanine--tRNA ligase [Arabidopsis thaliana]